jgi:putative methyltransferase (TIGR04325 family)
MADRSRLKSLLPPALLGPMRRLAGTGLRMTGPCTDWDAARRLSVGYDAPLILERVLAATREVAAGRADHERDAVLFAQPEPRFPLLAGLLHAAAAAQGRLHVIDFGGALGSVYWQYRRDLAGLVDLRWTVVEQAAFVEVGQREFGHGPLQFALTVEEAATTLRAPLVLVSSVLQYLPQPWELIERVAAVGASGLLIDRIPVSDEAQDQACVQHVPPRVYPASYPSWVFSRARLLERLDPSWALRWVLPCDEGQHRSSGGLRLEFQGYYLERRA